jgi:RHS repeat-associated protein
VYKYTLKDHLGNTRVTYSDKNNDGIVGVSDIEQVNHYYPFGLNMEGSWNGASGAFKYGYNGKEWNDDFGLGWNHQDWRFYDPAVDRWWSLDSEAESDGQISLSPYHFSYNNPVSFSDPTGREGDDPGIDWGAAAKGFVKGVVVGAVATVAVTALVASGGTAAPLIGYGLAVLGAYETGKTGYEVVSGKEAYTGRELSNSERSEKGGTLVGGFVGGGLAVKSGLTSKVAEGLTEAPSGKNVPNPNGKNGGQAHQSKIAEVEKDLTSKGYTNIKKETMVKTPGGNKEKRFMDISGKNPNTGKVEHHNVGKSNKNGTPVSREVKALDDVQKATGTRPTFHSYN